MAGATSLHNSRPPAYSDGIAHDTDWGKQLGTYNGRGSGNDAHSKASAGPATVGDAAESAYER